MERDESLFALPPPVLTGSGSVGIISVPGKQDTPLHTYRGEGIKVFRKRQDFDFIRNERGKMKEFFNRKRG